MEVGSIDATDVVAPVSRRARTAATTAVVDPPDPGLDAARLSAVVELIRTLTGREVKLVPPAAYFVSPPGPPPAPPSRATSDERSTSPRRVAPELVVATGIEPDGQAADPLEVDITQVLSDGTSDRMVLAEHPTGGLMLTPGLDLAL